jgi:hypothetical protein
MDVSDGADNKQSRKAVKKGYLGTKTDESMTKSWVSEANLLEMAEKSKEAAKYLCKVVL